MEIFPTVHLRETAGPTFITVRQAVDLLAEAHGAATSAAAAQLIEMFNDAVHEGRPALFERDGAALKAVAELGERYVAVIQSLDALRRDPPADDRRDPLANTMRDLRRRQMIRAGIPGASWYDTEFTLYPRRIATLDSVEVRVVEFEGFALLAPRTSSVREVPPMPVRGVPAAIAHENAVLAKLQELGFEPLALPPPPRGLSSPAKQAVLTALSRDDEDTRYEKAWKRLTKEERIKYR